MLTDQSKKLNNNLLIAFLFLFFTLFQSQLGRGQNAVSQTQNTDFFASSNPISIELNVNFDVFNDGKTPTNDYRYAALVYQNGDNKDARLKIKLKRRYSSRDSLNCGFPQLTLNFPKEKVMGTPFAGLDKVWLVTPCQINDTTSIDQLLLEYACYKAYEHITPYSFRVRLTHITLADSAKQQQSLQFLGFIIEDDESLAQRHNGKLLKISNLQLSFTDRLSLNMFAMFQYMIGNTQWTITTLYNMKLLSLAGKSFMPIPFEFSQSGLINAHNAKPAPYLKISDVRNRQFLGLKMPMNEFLEVKQHFFGSKQQMISEFENLELHSNSKKKQAIEYLISFFDELNSNQQIFVE